MINKKLSLTFIILGVAVLATIICSFCMSIALKPTVTEAEFPFSITYEFEGETVTINDVYKVRYNGNSGYSDTMDRTYVGEIGNRGEGNTSYTLKEGPNDTVILHTHFYADYMMSDTYDSYFDDEEFAPKICYYDADSQEYDDEESLSTYGAKIVSYDYPEPVENSFVFSHISYFSNRIVMPSVLISLLALIAILIFVKKEKDYVRESVDVFSIIANYAVGIIFMPFITFVAILIDITGGGPEFYIQCFYFFPMLSMLSVAASISLRRKGYGVISLVSSLIGPVIFAIYVAVCEVLSILI